MQGGRVVEMHGVSVGGGEGGGAHAHVQQLQLLRGAAVGVAHISWAPPLLARTPCFSYPSYC